MILTEKEIATVKDLQTQEQACIEKYQRYSGEAKDMVLKDLFKTLQGKEQEHYDSLQQVLGGKVPSCNCNDSDGRNYSPKATYDKMSDSADKKTDNFLATDCIASEACVLGVQYQCILFQGFQHAQAPCGHPDRGTESRGNAVQVQDCKRNVIAGS